MIHETSFQSCGQLISFDCIMSINLRFLVPEDSTVCYIVFSMLIVLFVTSVQVGPTVLLTCPLIRTDMHSVACARI